MTLAGYNGHEALTFTDYLDLGTGKTLHAEPGRTYDVAPASGRAVPDVPEPWFTSVAAVSWDTLELARELASEPEGAPAEGDGAPETSEQEAGEPAHDEDPETDTSQQS